MGRNKNGQQGIGARATTLEHILGLLLSSALGLLLAAGLVGLGSRPAQASLTNNSYDGNIYALYAGNGSLVPPRQQPRPGPGRPPHRSRRLLPRR